ncbi:MAG: hypothetical protein KAJ49_04535 [Arcobacteraceae bacterium]|nr:hypothetical protein [Arcobacteraceae bacterium]
MNLDEQLKILAKINGINDRLKLLKGQGEGSKKKTLKSMRTRRNRLIKKLVEGLQPSTSFYDETRRTS